MDNTHLQNELSKTMTENNSRLLVLEENIIELKEDNKQLKEVIKNQDIKINNLEFENKELKEENKELKQEIKELKEENKELKEEIKELKEENKELKEVIKNQNIKINNLEFNNFKTKLICAIQDLNTIDLLEKRYSFLFYIRKYRNSISHYIDKNFDNDDVITYKKLLLKNKLLSLSTDEIDYLNSKFSNNIFSVILDYLNTLSLSIDVNTLDSYDKSFADDWWD